MKNQKLIHLSKRGPKPDVWETVLGGTLAEVKQLVQSGAKLNKRTNDGFTALMLATGRGDPKITGYLIEQGADVNARNEIGQTALMIAALRGHKGIVKQLLAAGADLHAEDNEKRNAISWATSQQDFPEIVAMLGGAGINYDGLDIRGVTPLIRAVLLRSPKSVNALLKLGADETTKYNGKTAYEIALGKGYKDVCEAIEVALKGRIKK